MYLYKLTWYEENDEENDDDINNDEYEDNDDNGYKEIFIPMTEHLRKMDGKYKVDCITFGPVPTFEIFDRATLTAVDENKATVLSNSFDIYDDGKVEIFQPFTSYKLSLERCKLVGNMLKFEVYFK